jgi:ClpP class serine protease
MRFQRVIEQVYFRPWFITAESHAALSRLVQAKINHIAMDLSDFVSQREEFAIDANGIAHIHVLGTLGNGLSNIEKTCGATDYGDLCAEAAEAAGAKGLMLHIDSGGGMCEGCVETARAIAALPMPKVAHTSGMMCSAAYALGVGCDKVFSTDSATVGSIGTICPWVDQSALWERIGLSFQPIVSNGADLKAGGHGPSLTEAQRADWQEMVNDLAAQFVGHVKAHRDPNPEVFRAGAYAGPRAYAYGLTDGLASESQAYAALLAMTQPQEQG